MMFQFKIGNIFEFKEHLFRDLYLPPLNTLTRLDLEPSSDLNLSFTTRKNPRSL